MLWGLLFSCLFCNQNNNDDWDTWRWETGDWVDDVWDTGCSPWVSLRDAELASTDAVDFGDVTSPTGNTVQLYIQNRGNCDLDIESLSVLDDDTAVFSVSQPATYTIEPGDYTGITVDFTPSEPGTFNATLEILSSDPFEPEVLAALTGSYSAGSLTVEPLTIEAGELTIGCPVEHLVTLSAFDDAVSITELEVSGPELVLFHDELPLLLEADEILELPLAIGPVVEGALEASVTVLSTDVNNPEQWVSVTATGVGEPGAVDVVTEDDVTRIFPLIDTPVAASVMVGLTEDGTALAGWSYDSDANAVVFETDQIPEIGTAFTIDYYLQPECE